MTTKTIESQDAASPHKRRPRYRGTHPQHFSEKYKELHPDAYPEIAAHVMAQGKTPAGSHRPICLNEIVDILQPKSGQIVVDATLGAGGHATEIIRHLLPDGKLIGIDTDSIELPKTESRLRSTGLDDDHLIIVQTNYAALPNVLAKLGVRAVDAILADLGCSSMQLDDPERGFSYKKLGPLDLRMNPKKGRPASDWLNTITAAELEQILIENADEPRAAILAQAILEVHQSAPITQTTALLQVIETTLKKMGRRIDSEEVTDTVRRVFQAIRIAVNDEFTTLDLFLKRAPACLKKGGKIAILSFHSGEDRRVKKSFELERNNGIYSEIAPAPIRPTPEETHSNPRSACAKLRWARKG